jgi:capsular exopolysaccharide synthesis family protein
MPGEGKTTISINLAIALASRGKRVLLIDADLKKPSLNKLFNVDRKLGLTEILTGKFDGTNLPETEIKNLFVLASGSRPPNPVELLDSDMMRKFLERAANEFDFVVIDSPPSLNMADASVLTPYVDGVIMVVQPGKTPREAVRRVKERLIEVQGNLLGTVLNNPIKSAQARYGHRYGYEYGYGKKYGYGQDQPYGRGNYAGHDEHSSNGNEHSGRPQEVLDIKVASRQIESKDRDV